LEAVSADGRKLASAASNQVKVWQTSDRAVEDKTKLERLRELLSEKKILERTSTNALPPGWGVSGDSRSYQIGLDSSRRHGGAASAFIKSTQPFTSGFASVTQLIGVNFYRGKRVRLSGYIKADGIRQWAGLWMHIEGAGYGLGFDNMSRRPISGTSDWRRYEVVLDVPEDSIRLSFGALLQGEGQLWADDFELEIVGPEVSVTGNTGYAEKNRSEFMRRPEEERRLTEQKEITRVYNLPLKPLNMSFEGSN